MLALQFAILIVLICFGSIYCRTSKQLKVQLSHGGVIIGRHLTSHNGRSVRGFLGIPYAEPPVGELRFAAPVPVKPWQGEKLTIQDSNICIQRDPFRRDTTIEGSEDCLYLNVYVPETIDNKPLPVMVFFHGGGWICGSGISFFYGPDYLMDHDVIYVSGNFRLGILGFLSTETKDCPGNNGLKDQVEILKWIQSNIASFGGDPNSVTIFGESAGGASVTYHMMSPLSKGLFHKGIAQSGTNLNPWAQPAHRGVASNRANKLGELLECKTGHNEWSKLLKCLREKPAESIAAVLYDFFEWDTDPIIPFPPVIEANPIGAFININPRNKKADLGESIPLMAGLTTEEGGLKTAPLLNVPGILEDFKNNFANVLPISLNYDHKTKDVIQQITSKIDEFYFDGKHDWNKENHQNLTNLYTDGWFLAGIEEYLRIRLNAAGKVGPTYVYLFDHKGEASFTEIFQGGREDYYGVCHADELQYLFPIGKSLFVTAIPTKKDIEIRETLLQLWVNFATTSNPTPKDSKFLQWIPTTNYPIKYLKIGSQNLDNWVLMKNEIGLFEERVNFWRDLKAHLPVKSTKDEL